VLILGAFHPQDVIEQQVVVVRRGQPLEAELRAMNDDLAQFPNFRVDTELFHVDYPCLFGEETPTRG
jgi:hypothetical protein